MISNCINNYIEKEDFIFFKIKDLIEDENFNFKQYYFKQISETTRALYFRLENPIIEELKMMLIKKCINKITRENLFINGNVLIKMKDSKDFSKVRKQLIMREFQIIVAGDIQIHELFLNESENESKNQFAYMKFLFLNEYFIEGKTIKNTKNFVEGTIKNTENLEKYFQIFLGKCQEYYNLDFIIPAYTKKNYPDFWKNYLIETFDICDNVSFKRIVQLYNIPPPYLNWINIERRELFINNKQKKLKQNQIIIESSSLSLNDLSNDCDFSTPKSPSPPLV